MSSLTKKLLFSLMITLSSILMATTYVKAGQLVSFPNGYEDLKYSNTFYCMEHQKDFGAGTWESISTQTIRSDDPSQANRTLAKILYDGIVTGQGGYHQPNGGAYQYAIWKWCANYGTNEINVPSAIYDAAWAAVTNPTPYSEAGKATISLVENKMQMNGMMGSIKIKSLTGSISGINITFKDIASNDSNNNQTKTIDANSSSIPGWIELYKDEKCTQLIKVGEIKQNDTIYFKNLQPNYWIKKVDFIVTARSSGYTVTWTKWRKTTDQAGQQDLMSAVKSEGVETNASVSINTEYSYGKIKIKKVGVYTQNGEEKKTSKIKATFKLYCTTLNKWVSGTNTGRKTYVDSIDKASEYTSTTKVTSLYPTYEYQLVEVKVDNSDYNAPIKMVSAVSNLQKDLKVVDATKLAYPKEIADKMDKVYATSGVIVYAGKTNQVIVRNEKTTANLTIRKVEKGNTDKKIKGVSFLIYGEKYGWVKGKDGKYTYSSEIDKIDDYKHTTDKNGEVILPSLKKDTYYVYEIEAPKGYALKDQEKYMEDPKDHMKSLGSKVTEWVYNERKALKEDVTFEIKNKRTSIDLIFNKVDKDTSKPIQGVSIKVYSEGKGWVVKNKDGEYEFDANTKPKDVKPFITDENGEVKLENLELRTYKIYETETVEGYDIEDQEGYKADKISKENGWVYLGPVTEENRVADTYEYKFSKSNVKKVDIRGHVWLDVNPYKVAEEKNEYNYIYDFEDDKKEWKNSERKDGIAQRDELLSGITVRLLSLDKNEKLCDDTETDDNGFYEFKNINYKDAQNAYVEFVYDNEKYIVVDTLVGEDNRINSKAKEYTMTTDKLDDQKIVDEKIEGSAVTEKKADALMLTYDAKNYAINDVNLGLIPKNTPGMKVYEKLEYIKVALNGFTYTYKYDDPPITADPYAPKANSAESFMAISPTDIAYNKANGGEKLGIYVVYKIDVKNTETTDKDDIYKEKKLYLSELTNTFDTEWYEKSDEDIGDNEQNEQFKLWTGEGDTLKYNLKAENSAFKEGIKPQETKTSYIQFKVKDESLNRLLAIGKIEGKATTSYGKGYHEYLRTDNVWVDNKNVTAFKGVQGDYSKETKNEAGEKYYVHRSINVDSTSGDWAIKFELKESRKISGTVFEDNPVDGDVYKGNGILDDSENVRAANVKVELLTAEKEKAKLYQVDADGNTTKIDTKDIEITTDVHGNYTFDGVVPGYYYIRFTYGDGNQKMIIPGYSDPKIILARDYKSTIIAGPVAEADKNGNDNEWYTKFDGKEYSTAIDDLEQRSAMNGYIFKDDGKVYRKDENGNIVEVTDYDTKTIDAYTPLVGIKIENTQGLEGLSSEIFSEGKNPKEFNGFNFGLIKQQNTPVTPKKKITNVKYTNQVGATLVSDNPANSKSTMLSEIDSMAKLEVSPDMIYGSNIEVTYEVEITNETEKVEYKNEEFYKYGESVEGQEKEITIEEVKDYLDPKFNYGSITKAPSTNDLHPLETQYTESEEVNVDENGVETKTKYINITGWGSISKGETTAKSYTVTALISNNSQDANDTSYNNTAKIKTVSIDELASFSTECKVIFNKKGETQLTITPETGEDRSITYYIIGAVSLVILAGGIILIKKKVM